jgi:hypothetical protein
VTTSEDSIKVDGPAEYQLWADSFHEGEWACREIAKQVRSKGGTFAASYEQGFIPSFRYEVDGADFRISVYGNYASWAPQAEALQRLLAWGKPDFVLIEEDSGEILLAVEETAATPTGNQALQRCERQFGAAIEGFPFWYLIAEYGVHSDGGVRRDSIWPSLMGLEIMSEIGTPSIVLHYSDVDNPEDYESGQGKEFLFTILTQGILNRLRKLPVLANLQRILQGQIEAMEKFIQETWDSSLYLAPNISGLKPAELSNLLAQTSGTTALKSTTGPFIKWPSCTQVAQIAPDALEARTPMKNDPFVSILESDISRQRCYGLIKGTGSKPQSTSSLTSWIDSQNKNHATWRKSAGATVAPDDFLLDIGDFPVSPSGLRHVMTARRILYLYDTFDDVLDGLARAFPRLASLGNNIHSEEPALVYISNSVKPGRIFGDPYTGQISAYATSFGALSGHRRVIAYFPHQSVYQAARYLREPNNKGLRIMTELTDLLVFGGGVAINTKTLELL